MRGSDVVGTMGCGDECIYYPGKKYMDWELDDPAGQDDIKHRVEALIAELLKAAEPA
jgi:arsenate reductase (thioredoxin)